MKKHRLTPKSRQEPQEDGELYTLLRDIYYSLQVLGWDEYMRPIFIKEDMDFKKVHKYGTSNSVIN